MFAMIFVVLMFFIYKNILISKKRGKPLFLWKYLYVEESFFQQLHTAY